MRGKAGMFSRRIADDFFSSVSLLLHMDGSNGGIVFADSSVNSLACTRSGVTTVTSEKIFGTASAYSADANSHVTYETTAGSGPLHFGTGDFVIEFWIKQDGTQVDPKAIFSSACNTSPFWTFLPGAWLIGYGSSAGQIKLIRSSGGGNFLKLLEFDIPDNEWTFVAISRSGTSLRAFVDGSLVASQAISSSLDFATDGFFGLFRHDIRSSGSIGSAGYLDEVRITKGTDRGYTGSTISVPTAAFPDSAEVL